MQTLGGLPDGDCDMNETQFSKLIQMLLPSLKIMTISPSRERPNGYQRLRLLLQNGVVAALGHDRQATEEDILGALHVAKQHSARLHMTHMFNVSDFHHRDISLVNFGILSKFPKISKYEGLQPPTIELIGDFVHVHPMALYAAMECKGYNDVAFITDGLMDCKCEGQSAIYSGRKITCSNKRVVLEGTQTLAGSCATQLEIFRNLISIGIPIPAASVMLSGNPCRIAKLSHTGDIRVDMRADILLLNDRLELQMVFVNGTLAWKERWEQKE